MAEFEIRVFQPGDTQGVTELILPIQQIEFGVPVTLADQPDLLKITEFYQQGIGNFWVAVREGAVIGSIALIDAGNGLTALRKMFVAAAYRGKEYGIGQALLDTLLAHARANDVQDIILGTVEILRAARRFYEKNGFSPVAIEDLPAAYPRMAVDTLFYRLSLK